MLKRLLLASMLALAACAHPTPVSDTAPPDSDQAIELTEEQRIERQAKRLYISAQAVEGVGYVLLLAGDSANHAPDCIATRTLGAVALSAADGLRSAADGNPHIPSVDVNVSQCLEKRNVPRPAEVPADVGAVVAFATQAAAGAVRGLDLDCRTGEWVAATLSFIGSATGPILDEVSSPDGFVSVQGTGPNLAACE